MPAGEAWCEIRNLGEHRQRGARNDPGGVATLRDGAGGSGDTHVALYSPAISPTSRVSRSSIEAARHDSRIAATITWSSRSVGQGPYRASGLRSWRHGAAGNIQLPRSPAGRSGCSELLDHGLASTCCPSCAGAADLVLPSKLTNMLASGRPIVATAPRGSGLADEVQGTGLVTEPGDAAAFAAAIARLLDDDALRGNLGRAARARAEERWSKEAILGNFERELRRCVDAVS